MQTNSTQTLVSKRLCLGIFLFLAFGTIGFTQTPLIASEMHATGKSAHRLTNQVYLEDSSHTYRRINFSSDSLFFSATIYERSTDGLIQNQIGRSFKGDTGKVQTVGKREYLYDNQNRVLRHKFYEYSAENDTWTPTTRDTFLYFNNGHAYVRGVPPSTAKWEYYGPKDNEDSIFSYTYDESVNQYHLDRKRIAFKTNDRADSLFNYEIYNEDTTYIGSKTYKKYDSMGREIFSETFIYDKHDSLLYGSSMTHFYFGDTMVVQEQGGIRHDTSRYVSGMDTFWYKNGRLQLWVSTSFGVYSSRHRYSYDGNEKTYYAHEGWDKNTQSWIYIQSKISYYSPYDVLSTNEPVENQFKVFPNPAQDVIHIRSEFELKAYDVYDLQGKHLTSGTLKSTGKSYQLDIKTLSPGMYLIRLHSAAAQLPITFIKS